MSLLTLVTRLLLLGASSLGNELVAPGALTQGGGAARRLAPAHAAPRCEPMLPDAAKRRTLAVHLANNSAPIALWRVMKSATSSACTMMMQEFHNVKHLPINESGECGTPSVWRGLFDGSLSWPEAQRQRHSFVGLEPAVKPGWFPRAYHAFAAAYLDPRSAAPAARARVWHGMVHVLVVRQPLERAMSAFNFRMNKGRTDQFDVLGVCRQQNVSAPPRCFELCLRMCEGDARAAALFAVAPHTANMIPEQVCGNFLVDHLAHDSSLAVAKANLRRFSLVLDLAAHAQIASALLRCVLGWASQAGPAAVPHSNTNAHSTQLRLDDLPSASVERMRALMADDLALYDDAIQLMLAHHSAATGGRAR